jgi:L-fuculose-phosphate aldolase
MNSTDPNENVYRQQLSLGISLLERLSIIDFNGHFSVRLNDGNILINTGASVRSNIGITDFVVVGADGEYSQGDSAPPAELPLHVAIYQSRADVMSVVHGHPVWSTLLTSTSHEYQVTMPQGALLGEVPTYSSPMSVNNSRIAGAIAKKMGDGRATLLKAHGSVVTGIDVLETTVHAIYLELNAERQVKASYLGKPYIFSNEEIQSLQKGLSKRGLYEKCWNYYVAKFELDKINSYFEKN